MTQQHDQPDITFNGRVGPKLAAAIGAVAGLAASRRPMRGAVVGGAVGWAIAQFLNRRERRSTDVVDVSATETEPHSEAV